jgi:hypothetical protein
MYRVHSWTLKWFESDLYSSFSMGKWKLYTVIFFLFVCILFSMDFILSYEIGQNYLNDFGKL